MCHNRRIPAFSLVSVFPCSFCHLFLYFAVPFIVSLSALPRTVPWCKEAWLLCCVGASEASTWNSALASRPETSFCAPWFPFCIGHITPFYMQLIVSMVILLSVILNNYCDTLLLILIFLVLLYLQCTILQYSANVKIDTENSLLFLSLQHSRVGSVMQLCVRRNRCKGSLGP